MPGTLHVFGQTFLGDSCGSFQGYSMFVGCLLGLISSFVQPGFLALLVSTTPSLLVVEFNLFVCMALLADRISVAHAHLDTYPPLCACG